MANAIDPGSLIDAVLQGDERAFQQLYETTKSRVFNTALGYVRNREDAEEITQDVFVEVFRSLAAFNRQASITTWVYRIAVNKSLDFLKYRKRQKRFAFLTHLFDPQTGALSHEPVDTGHPGVMLENQENAAILFRAIDKLTDKQKTAYILTRVEGLSNIDAAEVMTVNVGTVESLVQRANENLRKQLGVWYRNRP